MINQTIRDRALAEQLPDVTDALNREIVPSLKATRNEINKQLSAPTLVTSSSGVIALDWNAFPAYTLSLIENVTSVLFKSSTLDRGNFTLLVTQTAAFAVTNWPSNVQWTSGTAPTTTTTVGHTDVIRFYFDGTTYFGWVEGNVTSSGISGPAGGDLSGTYPNPTIALLAVTAAKIAVATITDTQVAAANKDGASGTPSMRTLGTGAAQAAAGNDSRLSDSRVPTGAAGGDLGATYPNPTVLAIHESSGPTQLTYGAIADGQTLVRSGTTVIGTPGAPPGGAAGGDLSGTYPNPTVAAKGFPWTFSTAQSIRDNFSVIVSETMDIVAPGTLTLGIGSRLEVLEGGLGLGSAAGGDLSGTYPNPTIALLAVTAAKIANATITGTQVAATTIAAANIVNATITDVQVAAANKDGASGTASMRTLGTGAAQACAGADSRLSDSRAPNGSASGDLGGSYPSPTVTAIHETSGPTKLTAGTIADGEFLKRSGTTLISGVPAAAGSASGDLGGSYPSPTVTAVHETGGPTKLTFGAIADGNYLVRSGSTVIGTTNPFINGFRLTGVAGTPVMTADSTTLSTIYLSPYKGGQIALYNGTTWDLLSSAEVSLAVTSRTTDLPFDIFAYNNAGTVTLEFLDWTSATARATILARQNGVWCKTGALTRRWVGSCRARSATQFHWVESGTDAPAKFDLFNADNRVRVPFFLKASTDTWSYSTATWRQAQASTNYQVDVMVGLQEEGFFAFLNALSSNSSIISVLDQRYTGIGFDSTTAFTGSAGSSGVAGGAITSVSASISNLPTIGRHFYAWLEYAVATGTTTWYGDNGALLIQSGMTGTWVC